MNETIKGWFKKNMAWLIIILVLVVWGSISTGLSRSFYGKYTSLKSIISEAGGDELIEFIRQHGSTIISVYDDLVAVRGELEPAVERAIAAEQLNERAYELAERSNADFVEFRSAMASTGGTITEAVQRQSRINEIVARIEANNTAIKDALRSGDRKSK